MNKKIILPTITILTLAAGIYGVTLVQASNVSSDPHNTIIERLSEKFGLNENDVEAVFKQVRQERQAERQKAYYSRLNQLVIDGKISEDQKQLLATKHEELRREKQEHFDNHMSGYHDTEERKEHYENNKIELEKWAEENGIDLQYLFEGHGPRNHHNKGW